MRPVVTAAQMRAIDAETIETVGLPGAVLMENAGRAVVRCCEDLLGARGAGQVAVICGAGNNGGDGFVVARVLQEHGTRAELFLCMPEGSLTGDARLHADAFQRCGGTIHPLADSSELARHRDAIESADIIVDAIFGTGLERPIRGHLADIVALINRAAGRVVAVDLPSGVRADDGATLGVAVVAHRTVSMACAKIALVGAPGFQNAGHLEVAEIGIPHALARRVANIGVLEVEDIAGALGREEDNTHKGRRGHLLAVAGSEGKRGAGRLTAVAALRGGAGLVTLAAPNCDAQAADPVMTAAIGDVDTLRDAAAGKSAILIGPGMQSDAQGRELVCWALRESPCPLVLDADALNHLGSDLDLVLQAKVPVVMTPHPGEAGRLLNLSTDEIQGDRIAAVRTLADRSGAVVVLKGARTCICDGSDAASFVAINPTGGPALSTAGTGDVLAGLIAALLARGHGALLAAWAGVYWHGEAGRIATETLGGPGMIASDLLPVMPRVREALSRLIVD